MRRQFRPFAWHEKKPHWEEVTEQGKAEVCTCVCVCGRAEGSAVGAGYESGILVFKLSGVGQFQVMTRRRVRPQEWAAEKTDGRSLEWRSFGGREWTLSMGHSRHPTRAEENHHTKVRCLGPHGGGGEWLDDDISLIHLHSFIQEILTVDLLCLHRQPGRQGSFPDLLHHLQGPRVSAFPVPSWEGERALACWSFRHRGQGLKFRRPMKLKRKTTLFLLIPNWKRTVISIMNRQETILIMISLGELTNDDKFYVLCSVTSVASNSFYPMDYSPPISSVHGVFLGRILTWVAMPSSRASFQSRD